MDADYADDLVLLAKTLVQAKWLLHILKQAERGIDLDVNSDMTESMVLNEIVPLSDKPLKLEKQFTHLGSNISPTESKLNSAWERYEQLLIGYQPYGNLFSLIK